MIHTHHVRPIDHVLIEYILVADQMFKEIFLTLSCRHIILWREGLVASAVYRLLLTACIADKEKDAICELAVTEATFSRFK
jgi:hypothetical protein